MSFLLAELQALSSETRRKHPDIREAAEKSLAVLRASGVPPNLGTDATLSEDLLRPIFMGCATKNAKVVAISLGSLQRLIAARAVSSSQVPLIITTMGDSITQGVDIQLKILQTLPSLITNFPKVHGALLGDALLLCFRLHESKIAVVSSTAAATLRQLVMFVVDKMVDEDREPPNALPEYLQITLPDGGVLSPVGPSAKDAYSVFEDLCLLANGDKPGFLKLDYLPKTFALELIESVLTNYHELFRKHDELVLLLRHHLCPLLLKSLSERPVFALTLRCMRVVFLLLKQFSRELETESEVFLMLLIKIVNDDAEANAFPTNEYGAAPSRPPWMRVIAMEIMRGLCNDAELIRSIWGRYDAQESGSNVFTHLISSLRKLLLAENGILGSGSQMGGVGVGDVALPASGSVSSSGSGYSLDGVAGMVAGMMGGQGASAGLSLQGSSMKVQCIDQLDKADSPPIPESYIYLLGVQCIVCLCKGFASFTGPLYNNFVVLKRRESLSQGQGASQARQAPPALNFDHLSPEEPTTQQLQIVRSIIDTGWPAFLASLSFVISTNLADDIFVDVLASYQAMTNVSGMLGLAVPRDAFFTSLAKYAVPTKVVSSLDNSSNLSTGDASPRTPTTFASVSENLGGYLLGTSQQQVGLSERNLACLKVLLSCSIFLAGSLGESWFGVLETIQNGEYVLLTLAAKAQQSMTSPRHSSGGILSPGLANSRTTSMSSISASLSSGSGQPPNRHPLLTDLDSETMLALVQRLFESTKSLEDEAFKAFVESLCRLSREMVGMQTNDTLSVISEVEAASTDSLAESGSGEALSPRSSLYSHRRRASGIHIPKTTSMRSGDFGLSKLGLIAMLDIQRLIACPPDIAWDLVTSHLLDITNMVTAPHAIRTQASRVLDDILVVVARSLPHELQAVVQAKIMQALAEQIIPHTVSPPSAHNTDIEIRKMGLETLREIVQTTVHTLVVGWETMFTILQSVCQGTAAPTSDTFSKLPRKLEPLSIGRQTPLIKIAFQTLTLVCDSVSSLSPPHLRLCILTIGQFGKQADTNIALTAAASLLWSISDAIQAERRQLGEQETEYSEIWMMLLREMLGLCTDVRPEVRDGAIQTMFRAIKLYGSTLTQVMWEECVWGIIFPLLENLSLEVRKVENVPEAVGGDTRDSNKWNESKVHALNALSSIFHDFLADKLVLLASFVKAYDVFVGHIEETLLLENRTISAPAMRCLEKAVKATLKVEDHTLRQAVSERTWDTIDRVGADILPSKIDNAWTQESLVVFLDVIRCTRELSRAVGGVEWGTEKLKRLSAILQATLTYPNSSDYRPDVEVLPPVQSATMEIATTIAVDDGTTGVASLMLALLSDIMILPFNAAFDAPAQKGRKVTYVALARKTLPLVVDYFARFKEHRNIYEDGTVEMLISAFAVPIKLKYDCPAPAAPGSKPGKDQPLWKPATTCFLTIVKSLTSLVGGFDNVSTERVEGIWRAIIQAFVGGVVSSQEQEPAITHKQRDVDETFDHAFLATLQDDVVPYLGERRVPDRVIATLGESLHRASWVYVRDDPTLVVDEGTTDDGKLLLRERFAYWCFDLLFSICSDPGGEPEVGAVASRKRMAALCLPSLLNRCRRILRAYVQDESVRGNLPFSRAREEELLYVLRRLHGMRLYPGSLWAALSDDPTKWCIEQAALDNSAPISDAAKRTPIGHLFYFHGALCDIVSIPRRLPTTYVGNGNAGHSSELDARVLARECLKEVGRVLGMGS